MHVTITHITFTVRHPTPTPSWKYMYDSDSTQDAPICVGEYLSCSKSPAASLLQAAVIYWTSLQYCQSAQKSITSSNKHFRTTFASLQSHTGVLCKPALHGSRIQIRVKLFIRCETKWPDFAMWFNSISVENYLFSFKPLLEPRLSPFQLCYYWVPSREAIGAIFKEKMYKF